MYKVGLVEDEEALNKLIKNYLEKEDFIVETFTKGQDALDFINDKNNVNYIFHLLRSIHMKKYILNCVKGSAQPNLNLKQLSEFKVPMIKYSEQERIVSILDKFDALVNDISEGLPAELNARRKQYEYYRDKLLTFKKQL